MNNNARNERGIHKETSNTVMKVPTVSAWFSGLSRLLNSNPVTSFTPTPNALTTSYTTFSFLRRNGSLRLLRCFELLILVLDFVDRFL